MHGERLARGCLQRWAVSPPLPTLEGAPSRGGRRWWKRRLRVRSPPSSSAPLLLPDQSGHSEYHPIPQVRDSPGHCPQLCVCLLLRGHPTFRSPQRQGH